MYFFQMTGSSVSPNTMYQQPIGQPLMVNYKAFALMKWNQSKMMYFFCHVGQSWKPNYSIYSDVGWPGLEKSVPIICVMNSCFVCPIRPLKIYRNIALMLILWNCSGICFRFFQKMWYHCQFNETTLRKILCHQCIVITLPFSLPVQKFLQVTRKAE